MEPQETTVGTKPLNEPWPGTDDDGDYQPKLTVSCSIRTNQPYSSAVSLIKRTKVGATQIGNGWGVFARERRS